MRKLKGEKEKQAALEEKRKANRGKRKMKSRRPTTSDSGGESTQGPHPRGSWGGQPRACQEASRCRGSRPLW